MTPILTKLYALRDMMETDGWTHYVAEAQEQIDYINLYAIELPTWDKVQEAKAIRGHLISIVNARQIVDEDIAAELRPEDE